MSAAPPKVLRCGNCGADVMVRAPATLVVTCGHCGTLSRLAGFSLKSIGEVALPAPLASHFQIGTRGSFGGRAFEVRGQIQLDHGAGLWNEWAAETDGEWLWIAEAQGEIQVMREVPVEPEALPSRDRLPDTFGEEGGFDPDTAGGERLEAGARIEVSSELDRGGPWTIREIGRGEALTCRGEFPVEISIGTRTRYLDLVRGAHEVATLDFTRPGPAEFLSGVQVALDELSLDQSTLPEHVPERVAGEEITCPNCGGTIEVQDPERAITLGCMHCGTPLRRDTHLEAFQATEGERAMRKVPCLGIGTHTTLRGEELTVLGFMRRVVHDEGMAYPWSEYLLRTADGGYRWLVENDGHWSLVRAVLPSAVLGRGKERRIGAHTFSHFSLGAAEVDGVLGEFYWRVTRGDSALADDYVHPPSGTMLSLESTPLEVSASVGEYLTADEVADAFPEARLPQVRGVGAAQPNPTDARASWKAFALVALALLASCVAVRAHHANEVVLRATFGPTPAAASQESVEFSEPFTLARGGANLKVFVRAPTLNQGYLDVLGALVGESTGEVTTFTVAAQRYSGVSGGERWSEGDGDSYALLGPVDAGTYRLRLAARGYDRGVNTEYDVTVRSQVPRTGWFVLALVLMIVVPLGASMRTISFENRRWSKSDHAWEVD